MNTYSPNPSLWRGLVKAAVAELTSTQAQQYYLELTSEFSSCFVEGLLTIIAGTVYLGQLTRQYLYDLELSARTGASPCHVSSAPQLLLSPGYVPFGLLSETTKPNASTVRTDTLVETKRRLRMISTVDISVAGKPKPKTARSGQYHQCNTNIVFGIDSKTVKELRAMAKELGYKNLSRLTKRELLGLLA